MVEASWLNLLLVFARIVSFFSVVPFFNRRGIPVLTRVALSLLLAYLLYLTIGIEGDPEIGYFFFFSLVKQVLVGLAIGYLVLLYFVLFQMAGQFIDHKAGLMLSGIFDVHLGAQVTFIGQFYFLLALTFYLTVNGHHILFYALAESFSLIPIDAPFFRPELVEGYVHVFVSVVRLAFQISAPVVIALFVVDIALGFIARTVPQFHVFMEGLPLKVVLSLFGIALVLPLMGSAMVDIFTYLQRDLERLLRGWL